MEVYKYIQGFPPEKMGGVWKYFFCKEPMEYRIFCSIKLKSQKTWIFLEQKLKMGLSRLS